MPFADITKRQDPATRKRVSRMMLEMSRDPNYSWNRPPESPWQRLRRDPLGVIGPLVAGIAIALGIIWMMHRYMTQGFPPPDTTRIVYVRNVGDVKGPKEAPPKDAASRKEAPKAADAAPAGKNAAAPDDKKKPIATESVTGGAKDAPPAPLVVGASG